MAIIVDYSIIVDSIQRGDLVSIRLGLTVAIKQSR